MWLPVRVFLRRYNYLSGQGISNVDTEDAIE